MEFGGGDAQNGGSSGQGFMSEANFADVDMSNDADHMQDPANDAATQESKEEVDSRSVFVGNKGNRRGCYLSPSRKQVTWQHTVDYACTPEEVQQHFQSCGTVNRITIPTDKFGQPKGFAYVEFVETEAVEEALLLNDTELHGRQLKVMRKRTNIPGMKQFRPRRANPSMGFGYRRPAPAYMFSPYGYGRVPRYRRPARYMPYYFNGGA